MNNVTVCLVGARGMLAQKVKSLLPKEYSLVEYSLPDFDVTDTSDTKRKLKELSPEVIINCAAYTDVDGCESNIEIAEQVNGCAPAILAESAKELGSTLVHVSTDYVFAGDQRKPYVESDITSPQSIYGRSKLAGEAAILESGLSRFFIVRTSWLYGPGGKNFVETMVRLGKEREVLKVVADQVGSPTYTGDLARAIFNLLAAARSGSPEVYGIYHFSNAGSCSWYEFAVEIMRVAREAGEPIVVKDIVPITTDEYPLPARRPAFSLLSKEKYQHVTGAAVPHWQESLAAYFTFDRS